MAEVRSAPGIRALGAGYVLDVAIGRGATGEVWRGTRKSDELAVAVKILRPELASDIDTVTRFLRERSILLSLDHPHVIKVIDLVAEGSTFAIVMDLVEGPDLRSHLSRNGSMPEADAASLMAQVVSGLDAAHHCGVIHRDLKPENVLLDLSCSASPVARITDFGTARLAQAPDLLRLTGFAGTPAYIAPEVARGESATPASDLYALGIVFYELVAGETPFFSDNPFALLRQHVEEPPRRPGTMNDAVWELIARLLEKDPTLRPQSARVVAAELCRLCEQRGGNAPTLPAAQKRATDEKTGFSTSAPASMAAVENPTVVKVRPADSVILPDPIPNAMPGRGTRRRFGMPVAAGLSLTLLAAAIGNGAWWLAGRPPAKSSLSGLTLVSSQRVVPRSSSVGTRTLSTYTPPSYPGSGGIHVPTEVTIGQDRSVWFTETGLSEASLLARLDPVSHVVTQYALEVSTGAPGGIATGSGDSIWFTEPEARRVVEVTQKLHVRSFALPRIPGTLGRGAIWGTPSSIASSPDGKIWFTETSRYVPVAHRALLGTPGPLSVGPSPKSGTGVHHGPGSSPSTRIGIGGTANAGTIDAVGKLDPGSGRVDEFRLPPLLAQPTSVVTTGSATWVLSARALGELPFASPSNPRVIPIPSTWVVGRDPESLALGGDGALWFPFRESSDPNTEMVARLDPDNGSLSSFPTGMVSSEIASDITAGTADDVWFTTFGGNSLGRMTTGGVVSALRVLSPDNGLTAILPLGIAVDRSNGTVWFAELRSGQIGELSSTGD